MYFWSGLPDTWLSYGEMPMIFPHQHLCHPSFQFLPQIQSPNLPNSSLVNQNLERQPESRNIPNRQTQRQPIRNPIRAEEKSPRPIKVSRNIKSLIIKDFIRFLRKDASKIIPIKEKLNSTYPIKDFLQKLNSRIPSEKQKYIKVKSLEQLCFDYTNEEFSQILRILLHNFLGTDFEVQVLNKKKNKAEYLKGRRELYGKIFKGKYAYSE